MRLYIGFAALLLSILYCTAPAKAQVITEGPDSVRVLTLDTLDNKGFFLARLRDLDKPEKAALYSAILPGGGQIYNKAYWKLPIVYATGAVLGYFLIDNNNKYQDFRNALNKRRTDSSDVYVNNSIYGVYNPANGVTTQRGTENLRSSRDYYRRNRDLTILLSIGAYALQIAEAYVHAHLKEFDVSDDLALRVQPGLVPAVGSQIKYSPALTFTLYTRSK